MSRKEKEKRRNTQFFPIDRIRPGDNSRKHFSEAGLDELAHSLKSTGGVLQPVLGVLDPDGEGVELIIGERRWRAAKLAQLHELEVKLVERPPATDRMKWNLVENLQRESLGVLEAARRVKGMLDLIDEETGCPVWTVRALADELGKAPRFISECCELLESPKSVLAMLERGELAPAVAAMIGSLPEALRERAANEMVFRVVGGPMTKTQARLHLGESFRRDLRRADFNRDDADLIELAGPCSVCEWNGGNRDDVHGRAQNSICLNPACFTEKCAAHAKATTEAFGNHGVKVLNDEESGKIFETHSGELKIGCGYVDVKAGPDAYLLKDLGVAKGRSWEDLFEDEVPVVVAFDLDSNERCLVELKLAVLAVQRSSSANILKSGADTELLTMAEKDQERREKKAKQAAADTVLMEGCSELFQLLSYNGGWGLDWVMCLIRLACAQGLQNEDILFLCRVLDPTTGRSGKPWECLEKLMERELQTQASAMAFLVLSLQARRLRLEGFESWATEESPMWAMCQLAQFDPASWVMRSESRVKIARSEAKKEHVKRQIGLDEIQRAEDEHVIGEKTESVRSD